VKQLVVGKALRFVSAVQHEPEQLVPNGFASGWLFAKPR
jgi:hypothetical protein